MSLPTFPDRETVATREEVINQIISSIAMEELGLSHIINAEGEKLQYALGTIPGQPASDEPLTMEEILALNESIHKTLDSTMMNQFFLKEKLLSALAAATMQGPTGATGPQGPATIEVDAQVIALEPGTPPTVTNIGPSNQELVLQFGIPRGATGATGASGTMTAHGAQAGLLSTGVEVEIQPNGTVIFDTLIANGQPDITYNATTGIFHVNNSGQKSFYLVNWWLFVEGSSEVDPTTFAVYQGDTVCTKTSCAWPEMQMSGSAMILLEANQQAVEISLRNISADAVTFPDISDKAQITILGFRRE